MRTLRSLGERLLAIPPALRWIPAAVWIALIWQLSSRPMAVPGNAGLGFGVFWNLGHPFEYGVLAVWIALLLPREQGWPKLEGLPRYLLFGALLVIGITDELRQGTIPERNGSLLDAVSDGVGAWYALSAARWVAREDGPGLTRCLRHGLLACAVAALGATLGARWFPELEWL
jgi:VanZ family protein